MKEKLTLSIDKKVKEKAKKVAFKRGESVSQMVEDYLSTISNIDINSSIPEDSIVSELAGSVSAPKSVDYKAELADSLEKKYNA